MKLANLNLDCQLPPTTAEMKIALEGLPRTEEARLDSLGEPSNHRSEREYQVEPSYLTRKAATRNPSSQVLDPSTAQTRPRCRRFSPSKLRACGDPAYLQLRQGAQRVSSLVQLRSLRPCTPSQLAWRARF